MAVHALFIGVNKYADRNIRELLCAQRDASELYHLFKRELGYGDNAHLLEAPRVEDVYDQLEAIGQRVRAGDTFVLYFAGHGYEPQGGGDQFLLLGGARLALLKQASGGAPAGTLSVRDLVITTDAWPQVGRVLVFDACRSELMPTHGLQGLPVFGSDRVLQRLASRDMGLDVGPATPAGASRPGTGAVARAPVIIKACQSGQLAVELLDHGRSVFGKALDDALKSARRAGRAVLTDGGLLDAVAQRMARLAGAAGQSQKPWMSQGAPEVLLYQPEAAPKLPQATPEPAPASAQSAAPRLAALLEDFERQFAAGQLQWPPHDCCVATLALLREAGLGAAGLARHEAALREAQLAKEVPAAAAASSPADAAPPPSTPAPPVRPKPAPAPTAAPAARPPTPAATPSPHAPAGMPVFKLLGLAAFLVAGGVWLLPRGKREEGPAPAPAAASVPAPAPAAALTLLDGLPAAQMQALQTAAAQAAGLRVVFTDALKGGGQGPQMVVVPAGRFTMGAPDDERRRYVAAGAPGEWADWERPHQVTVARAFALAKHEVTRGEFAAFVKGTGHATNGGCWYWDKEWKLDRARNWRSPGFPQTDQHPVVCVSAQDADAYARWMSEQTTQDYRLPSEAEWELAARAGTTTRRYWGDDLDDRLGCAYANVLDQDGGDSLDAALVFSCRDGSIYTATVGSKQANTLNLKDMLGNASEWVADCFDPSLATIPPDGSARTQCSDISRIVRGGFWGDFPRHLRSANRFRIVPDNRNSHFGFRLARTLQRLRPSDNESQPP